MTRIIAGLARGRTLRVPAKGTRPTSDRVRESLFSSMDSELRADGAAWSSVRALDLFAGSGALGLEALSRGAASAVFVEKSRDAARILRANIELTGLAHASVVERDAAKLGVPAPGLAGALPATAVFVDPPYEFASAAIVGLLVRLHECGWIADDAHVVVERSARSREPAMPSEWFDGRTRAFGDTALWYGRVAGDHAKEAH